MDKSETYAQSEWMKWEPIETVDRTTGKQYLLYSKSGIRIGYWQSHYWVTIIGRYQIRPTHWMPLPEPPKE